MDKKTFAGCWNGVGALGIALLLLCGLPVIAFIGDSNATSFITPYLRLTILGATLFTIYLVGIIVFNILDRKNTN